MVADRKWLFLALGALVVALAGAEAFYVIGGNRGGGSVQGYATIPTDPPGQASIALEVQGRVVHLLGLQPPGAPCPAAAAGADCTSLAAGKLAEMVAGKVVRCALQELPGDSRNWGVCRTVGGTAPTGDRVEDTVNGRLLLAGWALPNEQHGRAWMQLGQQARDAGLLPDVTGR